MTAVVYHYRANPVAQTRWKKMDTDEPVIARHNGLPITAASWTRDFDTAPSEYCAPDKDSA